MRYTALPCCDRARRCLAAVTRQSGRREFRRRLAPRTRPWISAAAVRVTAGGAGGGRIGRPSQTGPNPRLRAGRRQSRVAGGRRRASGGGSARREARAPALTRQLRGRLRARRARGGALRARGSAGDRQAIKDLADPARGPREHRGGEEAGRALGRARGHRLGRRHGRDVLLHLCLRTRNRCCTAPPARLAAAIPLALQAPSTQPPSRSCRARGVRSHVRAPCSSNAPRPSVCVVAGGVSPGGEEVCRPVHTA